MTATDPRTLDPIHAQARAGLTALVEPRLGECRRAVRRQLTGPDVERIEPLFAAHLLERLAFATARTLALEMRVATLRGEVPGETTEDRYARFTALLLDHNRAAAIWAEYPVLDRLVESLGRQWVESTVEFLTRFRADREELEYRWGLATLDLASVQAGLGDFHHGGRSVLGLTFADGTRLAYKPRSLAVEHRFQDLLAFLNRAGATPAFPILRLLDRGTHGWVEWVPQGECETADAVRRFYRRQGANLAVVHALKGNDIHQENVIARGEYPVLIDLETLFHPHLYSLPDADDALQRATESLADSVIAVGLLPTSLVAAGKEALSVDGLGSEAEAWTPTEVPVWHGLGTDAMELRREKVRLPVSRNRATFDGRAVDSKSHAEEFLDGFRDTYRLIERHRDELLADGGPVAAFDDVEIRVVLRPTQTYGNRWIDGLHPDHLRSDAARDRHLAALEREAGARPNLRRVLDVEKKALARGDIPRFTTRPGSCDLVADDGSVFANYFDRPGLDLARDRILAFGDADLARQEWYVRATLELPPVAEPVRTPTPSAVGPKDLAVRVGDRLLRLAIKGKGNLTWNTVVPVGEDRSAISPVSLDLYDGLPGIVLFLAYLGRETGLGRFTDAARAAAETQRRLLDHPAMKISSAGGFTGAGGLIYAMTNLGTLWNDREWIQRAVGMAEGVPERIERDRSFDVIDGTAGCLASLHSLRPFISNERFRSLTETGLNHLRTHETPQRIGTGWLVPAVGERPLLGFSHGTAGIAWAIQGAVAATGLTEFTAVADAALAYERSQYSAETGNWPDLRADAGHGADRHTVFWCHGAPGVGLARAHAMADRPDAQDEIETAFATTRDRGFGHSHCLCHGDVGNLLLLREMAGDDPARAGAVRSRTDAVVNGLARSPFLCGSSQNVETPGLMTGLAGIGWGLLMLAGPGVPNVLRLEPSLTPNRP
jgi:type 2 lantibiotic biosynthesis protein LanM